MHTVTNGRWILNRNLTLAVLLLVGAALGLALELAALLLEVGLPELPLLLLVVVGTLVYCDGQVDDRVSSGIDVRDGDDGGDQEGGAQGRGKEGGRELHGWLVGWWYGPSTMTEAGGKQGPGLNERL